MRVKPLQFDVVAGKIANSLKLTDPLQGKLHLVNAGVLREAGEIRDEDDETGHAHSHGDDQIYKIFRGRPGQAAP